MVSILAPSSRRTTAGARPPTIHSPNLSIDTGTPSTCSFGAPRAKKPPHPFSFKAEIILDVLSLDSDIISLIPAGKTPEPVLITFKIEFNKLLRDFPFHEWFEAADGCELCGAKYKVMIVSVDKEGVFGSVEWCITHKPDCPIRFNEETEEAFQIGDDVVGWEFMPEPFTIQGKKYYPLKSRANIGPCVNCGRLIVGVPLILFLNKGKKGELDFCFECVKHLGIMDIIRKEIPLLGVENDSLGR